ncbi:hypothetical protein HanIR_Chr02g0093671 [Helianthus annuus]|nr:hypothetical protein HanIR_Chr02g0093671 [Helianthus annuus]
MVEGRRWWRGDAGGGCTMVEGRRWWWVIPVQAKPSVSLSNCSPAKRNPLFLSLTVHR